MTVFSVWAPNTERAEVCVYINGGMRRFEMEKEGDGWHFADVEPIATGTRYGFVLDGGKPLPDPRSPSQPDGVHGLSEVVDHDEFAWSDDGWRAPALASAIIYELHIGTFTPEGTFMSAIERLDHLVELGVTHIELMPVAEAGGERGWGYDGVDLYAPHHGYGGPTALKQFVDACHTRGLAVLLDVVYNHLGPDGNYLGAFGPYFTDTYSTPWGVTVNYDDRGSDEVRRFVIDNAVMWLRDYHFDGLRLDAIHAIYDKSAVHILEALSLEIEHLGVTLGRPLVLIAESDLNDPLLVRTRDANGYGIDAQWSDDFHHAMHSAITGERNGYYADFEGLSSVVEALSDTFVFVGQYQSSRQKSHGRSAAGISTWRFLGYAQNHDQIGNRAAGERLVHLVAFERAKVAAALVLMSPFVPMLFQGEEWGASSPFQYFTDHNEELGKAVSEGRKHEFAHFGWDPKDVPDPQEPATFTRSKLRWDELSQGKHVAMFDWHRALIALRRNEPALNDGGADLEAWEQHDVLSLRRSDIRLVANLGVEPVKADDLDAELLLASHSRIELAGSELILPPNSVAILREG